MMLCGCACDVYQEKLKQVFDNLIELEHPNIAKFHKYWTDVNKDRPRVGTSYLLIFHLMIVATCDQ